MSLRDNKSIRTKIARHRLTSEQSESVGSSKGLRSFAPSAETEKMLKLTGWIAKSLIHQLGRQTLVRC